jgi:hypothetical protein
LTGEHCEVYEAADPTGVPGTGEVPDVAEVFDTGEAVAAGVATAPVRASVRPVIKAGMARTGKT